MRFFVYQRTWLVFLSFAFGHSALNADQKNELSPKDAIKNICAFSFQTTGPLLQKTANPFHYVNQNFLNKLDPSKSLFTQNQVEDFLNQEIEPEKLVEGEFVEDILDLHQLRNAQAQKSLDDLSSLKVKDFDLNDPEQYVEIVDANYAKSEERRLRRIFQLIRSKAILFVSQLGFPEDRAIEKSIDAVREMLKAMSESEIRSTNTSLDYLDSLLKSIDPHSAVYQQSAESFMAGLHSVQKLSLGVTFEPRYGGAKIKMIIPNGRADQSGFEVGDTVMSARVDGKDEVVFQEGMLFKFTNSLNGDETVHYKILKSDGKTRVISVDFSIETPQKAQESVTWEVVQTPQKRNALYLRFDGFYHQKDKKLVDDVKKAISDASIDFPIIHGLTIDLRFNGGGNTAAIQPLFDFLAYELPAFQSMKEPFSFESETMSFAISNLSKLPLTILTSENSASAAEIFSAAIQDYGRGIIIGQQEWTFGKSTQQLIIGLKIKETNESADISIRATNDFIGRPTGDILHAQGVHSDISLGMPSATERESDLEHYMKPPKGFLPNFIESFQTDEDIQNVTDEVRSYVIQRWEERRRNDPYWVFIQDLSKRLEKLELERRQDKDTHFKTVSDATDFYQELAEDTKKVVTRGYFDRGSSWGSFSDEAEHLRVMDDFIEAYVLSQIAKLKSK